MLGVSVGLAEGEEDGCNNHISYIMVRGEEGHNKKFNQMLKGTLTADVGANVVGLRVGSRLPLQAPTTTHPLINNDSDVEHFFSLIHS